MMALTGLVGAADAVAKAYGIDSNGLVKPDEEIRKEAQWAVTAWAAGHDQEAADLGNEGESACLHGRQRTLA